jgi:hypothetical protein
MSSSTVTYAYIPNLVGRQMLRVPFLPCEEDISIEKIETSTSSRSLTLDTTSTSMTSSYSRDTSPAPSFESIEEVE